MIPDIVPSEKLFSRIIASISAARRRLAWRNILISWGVAGVSLAGLIAACWYAVGEVAQSGFLSYFSLVFSGDVFSVWRELGLALIESLPVVGIVFILSAVFAMVGSISFMIQNYHHERTFAIS